MEDLDFVPSSYFKKLKEDIWEVRITFGSNAYRIFCFLVENSVVVLTHGVLKSEIETKAYKRDFLNRRLE
ncbi:MAG: type II toxin-antitoxin system RelE/ParE family toxin [bacterium]